MKIPVDADALYRVLFALNGPGHLIRELQATRDKPPILTGNPIDMLINDYKAGIQKRRNRRWMDGNPPQVGWWDTKYRHMYTRKDHELRLWWNGTEWRASPHSRSGRSIQQRRQWSEPINMEALS